MAIPLADSVVRKCEAPVAIAVRGIDAREIEDDVRREIPEDPRQVPRQQPEIFVVPNAITKPDVEADRILRVG